MIRFRCVNNGNLKDVLALRVEEEQERFIPSAEGILARAWAYREKGAILRALHDGERVVGLALTYEEDEEPACYYLMELLIDRRYQGRGYGYEAVRLIIDEFSDLPRYPVLEVSVDRDNARTLHVFKKAGFADSGYTDPGLPQYVNLVRALR